MNLRIDEVQKNSIYLKEIFSNIINVVVLLIYKMYNLGSNSNCV